MERATRIKKIILVITLMLVMALVGGVAAFKIYTSNYYDANEAAISELAEELVDQVHAYESDEGMVFLPQNQEYKAVIVFYPGARVEYTAYSELMYKLAERGYICLLPRMAENVALLSIYAVDGLKALRPEEQELVEDLDWYIAGHSLGGVAATKYVVETLKDAADGDGPKAHGAAKYKGVILCASYPTESLKGTGLRLLSILGSNDGVVKMAGYDKARNNWPEDAEEYIIQGGIHSYFGDYGIQKGDGVPDITNDQQIDETVDVIDAWIKGE